MTSSASAPAPGPVIAIVTIDDADRAPELVAALAEGGVRSVEFVLRTPAALAAIARVAGTAGVGVFAGSVLTPEQVDACADAGAELIVSPGLDDGVIERSAARGVAALPGIATATEAMRALAAGLTTVKFFPADLLGGLAAIRALAAPLPGLRFVPSGGVSPDNLTEYLREPSVVAVGGSWIAPRDLIAAGEFDAIRARAAAAAGLVP